MNRRRKSCYRPYEGKRWPLWRKAVLALLLAGALAFGTLAAPCTHVPSRLKMYIREPFALVKSFLFDR